MHSYFLTFYYADIWVCLPPLSRFLLSRYPHHSQIGQSVTHLGKVFKGKVKQVKDKVSYFLYISISI